MGPADLESAKVPFGRLTGGCHTDPPLYCPASPNTRGQMAVFLVKTFFP